MKKIIRNTTLLFFPFLLLILVNEISRGTLKKSSNSVYGKATINSGIPNINTCTWQCHDNTNFCKENHVKYLNDFDNSDRIYFGIINSLQKTKNYSLANVFFLVILFPFLILYFTIQSLNIQDKINSLKH